ncbi:hypothetical protein ACE1CI_25300 [Aerosakkonemataceae cyanobacterium BLCC-F50]|uniref:Uncharacterized protein n=1 Tax=Floridaenema flaviceps BLCC-F50 TaxID=3153642 RepID=A0ABV4XX59_9CYAN
MKSHIQRLSLLVGTIALSVSIASALPAYSQSANPNTPPAGMRMRPPNFLNLTAEQETKMEQIRQNTRSRIDAILTAEQKAQLQRDRENRKPPAGAGNQMPPPPPGENGGNLPAPFASLNLTTEQRTQIEAVMRSSREQMDAVLTPEQRQQLQQFRQQQQQRRQGN